MDSMTNTITIRVNEDINNEVLRVSKENRLSKSEVVRTALEGELQKLTSQKSKVFTEKEREVALQNIGIVMKNTSNIRIDNSKALSNLNQITKKINSGDTLISSLDVREYKEIVDKLTTVLNRHSEVLNDLWLILG